jgi:hypothetical protein
MHQHDAECAHGQTVHAPPIPAQATGEQPPAGAPDGPPAYAVPPGYQLPPQYEAPPESRAYRFLMALWTKPAWLAPLAVLGCVAAAFGYVLANDPTDAQRDPLGPCVFKSLTGLDCPGCGGTRMVWYVLHGDLPQAARHHVIALVALPVVLWLYVVWAARRWFGVTLPSRRIPVKVWGGYLVAWLAFSVLRDLPWEPFSLLLV